MKKIITAINDPTLNANLKKEAYIEIVCKDIQYKEAILEILEKKFNIDILIINEKLPGEIELINLIEKINKLNRNIKVIIILEKNNIKLEKELKEKNIINIFYNEKIEIKELINIINEKEINKEELIEEIKRLKEIIENKKYKKIDKKIKLNKKK